MNHTRFCLRLALAGVLLSVFAPMAHSQFLVGAGLYSSTSNGTANPVYLYSTNASFPPNTVASLFLTPNSGNNTGKNIAIPLSNGSNNFTFDNNFNQPPGGFVGFELFFATSATPYNPASGARTPDLVVFAPTTSTTTFTVPAAGTQAESYDHSGQIAANGLTTFSLAGTPISITAFSSSTVPNGSFTVNVGGLASTPEPSASALLAGCASALLFALRRRRK